MSESENQKQKQIRRRRKRCGEYFRQAKRVLIRCGKKESNHKKNQKPYPCSSDDNNNNAVNSGKKSSFVLNRCFCCCYKQPSTLESYAESVTSDPNDSKFTFEMLRNIIEKNDFYSKDCNPHQLDPPSSSISTDD